MNYNCIIGIDPGASGGIAMFDGHLHTYKMPKDLNELKQYLQHCIITYEMVAVFIEKLSIQHRDFMEGGKVFRLQKMMENYSQLKAIIKLFEVDYAEVHPLTWQSRLRLRIKGEEKHQRKLRYKDEAFRRYPDTHMTLWNCDAVLIMHFGREVLKRISKKDVKWLDQNFYNQNKNELFH